MANLTAIPELDSGSRSTRRPFIGTRSWIKFRTTDSPSRIPELDSGSLSAGRALGGTRSWIKSRIAVVLNQVAQLVIKVQPVRIVLFNKSHLPRAFPPFQLPLSCLGGLPALMHFYKNQFFQIVPICKTLDTVIAVLPGALRHIVGLANVEHATCFVGHDECVKCHDTKPTRTTRIPELDSGSCSTGRALIGTRSWIKSRTTDFRSRIPGLDPGPRSAGIKSRTTEFVYGG